MKIISSDQKLVLDGPSLFLAGPTPRSSDVKSWRIEAVEILQNIDFQHTVLIPEMSDWTVKFEYADQVEWEYEGLENASLIVFWIPRDLVTLPGFTTNVEFGRYVDSRRILYGRPDNAKNIRYLDWLYFKLTKFQPIEDLKELLVCAKERLDYV